MQIEVTVTGTLVPRLDAVGGPEPARVRRRDPRRGRAPLRARARASCDHDVPRARHAHRVVGAARDAQRLRGAGSLHVPLRPPAHRGRDARAGGGRHRRRSTRCAPRARPGSRWRSRCPRTTSRPGAATCPAIPQIYMGWMTPEDHFAIRDCRRGVPRRGDAARPRRRTSRTARCGASRAWTAGCSRPTASAGRCAAKDHGIDVPARKEWVRGGRVHAPGHVRLRHRPRAEHAQDRRGARHARAAARDRVHRAVRRAVVRGRDGLRPRPGRGEQGRDDGALHAQRTPRARSRPAPGETPARPAARPVRRSRAPSAAASRRGSAVRAWRWWTASRSPPARSPPSPPRAATWSRSRVCPPPSASASPARSPPTHALQCGFCTPGIVIRAQHLLEHESRRPRAPRSRAALDEHLCRCTGYVKILDAIELLARTRRAARRCPRPCATAASVRRSTATAREELVLGARAVRGRPAPARHAVRRAHVFAARARARACASTPPRARALPGVVAVVTAADVPGERWNGLIHADWPAFVARGEEVRCVGDVLAAVAAESEVAAREAAALVEVDVRAAARRARPGRLARPRRAAREPGAREPAVALGHPPRRRRRGARRERARGLAARGRRSASSTCSSSPSARSPSPTPGGGLHLYTQGQGIFDDRRQVARAARRSPEERVFVELVPNGGAFGGKEDMSVQAQTALLAWVTQPPGEAGAQPRASRSACIPSATRSHRADRRLRRRGTAHGGHGAHAGRLRRLRLGRHEGARARRRSRVRAVPGAERRRGIARRVHQQPAVRRDARLRRAAGGVRARGRARHARREHAALDRWEIRWRNAVDVGDLLTTGQVLEKSCGIRATLARRARPLVRVEGGRPCGGHRVRGQEQRARQRRGRVGQGATRGRDATAPCRSTTPTPRWARDCSPSSAQFAAEVTGLPAHVFRPKVDSTFALGCGQTTGSRATLFAGNAVTSAARKLRAALDRGRHAAEPCRPGVRRRRRGGRHDAARSPGPRSKTHTSYGYATQVVLLDARGPRRARGRRARRRAAR